MTGKLQQSRDELSYQALHDPLTGLPNRTLFMDRMHHAIARSDRRKTPMSVLYLDLDGFKEVNDTRGHQAGDEMLVAVAERLRSCLRDEDAVARLGGDEFAILLEEELSGAIHVADRVIATSRRLEHARPCRSARSRPASGSPLAITRRSTSSCARPMRRCMPRRLSARADGRSSVTVPAVPSEASQTLRAELQRAIERERVRRSLPADREAHDWIHRRCRGARPVEPSHPWIAPPDRFPGGGRGRRPHRVHRPLGPRGGVPAGARLAG